MHALGVVLIDLIIALFFFGLLGSAVVVLISFVEDFHELFASDDSTPGPASPAQSTPEISTSASFTAPKSSGR